jgi:hypothetical protein
MEFAAGRIKTKENILIKNDKWFLINYYLVILNLFVRVKELGISFISYFSGFLYYQSFNITKKKMRKFLGFVVEMMLKMLIKILCWR